MAVARRNGMGLVDTADVRPAAERLLAERYARGEIDDDEYARRQRVLHA